MHTQWTHQSRMFVGFTSSYLVETMDTLSLSQPHVRPSWFILIQAVEFQHLSFWDDVGNVTIHNNWEKTENWDTRLGATQK